MAKDYIVRRTVANGSAIASLHPVIGPVYWEFVDESECNAPDYYGLTCEIESAYLASRKYERWNRRNFFLSQIIDGAYEIGMSQDDDIAHYHWGIKSLAEKAKTTPGEFMAWVASTTWVECPAPVRTMFISDFNGHLGYRAEWTDDPGKAIGFSQAEIDDGDDELDVILARSLGEFVSRASPYASSPRRVVTEDKNYALLADVDYAFHRMQIGDDQTSYDERAMAYAALAGRQSAKNGLAEVSQHLSKFPCLVAAFQMGFALENWCEEAKNGIRSG